MKKSEGKEVTEYHPRKVVWILVIWLLILCAFGLLARPPGRVAYKRQAFWKGAKALGWSINHVVSDLARKLGLWLQAYKRQAFWKGAKALGWSINHVVSDLARKLGLWLQGS